MTFNEKMIDRAKANKGTLVLAEGIEERTLKDARIITDKKIATKVYLVGKTSDVEKKAKELGVKPMERKSHHIVEAATNATNACASYPFLYAVGSGFVEGPERIHVEANLVIGKLGKIHLSHRFECHAPVGGGNRHSGNHFVRSSR